MDAPIFYALPQDIVGDDIRLDKDELHHASKVMRLSVGSQVIVIDGQGMAYRGELTSLDGRSSNHVRCHSTIRNLGETMVHLTLASGLSTGHKFDSVVQKGTELGVKRFVPILAHKSKAKLDNHRRAEKRLTRLEKVALAAAKQSRRSFVPQISHPMSVSEFIEQTDETGLNLIFHPSRGNQLNQELESVGDVRQVSLLVGPESGFTDEEVEAALGRGFRPVSLGNRVLRTETAGPVVCALVLNQLGEMS